MFFADEVLGDATVAGRPKIVVPTLAKAPMVMTSPSTSTYGPFAPTRTPVRIRLPKSMPSAIRPIPIVLKAGLLVAQQAVPINPSVISNPQISANLANLVHGTKLKSTTAVSPLSFPLLSSTGAPQIGFEQREGLWIVSVAALPLLQALLTPMVYVSAGSDGVTETGQASLMVGQTGAAEATVEANIASGNAALIEKSSILAGTPNLLFTRDPAVVAAHAGGTNATHALVTDKPDSVVGPALAILNGGSVPASVVKKPNYIVPAIVGVGVILVGAIVFRQRKRQ
jgi:hypothetical protein